GRAVCACRIRAARGISCQHLACSVPNGNLDVARTVARHAVVTVLYDRALAVGVALHTHKSGARRASLTVDIHDRILSWWWCDLATGSRNGSSVAGHRT